MTKPSIAPPAVKHSVGEWEYDDGTGQVDVADGTICVGITWRPNGYLIAAAPEMYDALMAIVMDEEDITPELRQHIERVLNKAEGR